MRPDAYLTAKKRKTAGDLLMLFNRPRQIAGAFGALLFIGFVVSAQASIVWDLNPNQQNASVGSSSRTYTSSGFSITAYGFDNDGGIGTAHDLFYKNIPDINGLPKLASVLRTL
jgi:hypothetical protein